ncbi:MAG: hypothetical protein ACYTXA_17275 [Nostoc sp.]
MRQPFARSHFKGGRLSHRAKVCEPVAKQSKRSAIRLSYIYFCDLYGRG